MRVFRVVLLLVSVMALAYAPFSGAVVEAQDADLFDFMGIYIGEANAVDIATGQVEQRDIMVEIRPYSHNGFVISSEVIMRVDGRRSVPGVKRRFNQLLFEYASDQGYYVEVQQADPFRESEGTNVVGGDPVRWAKIKGSRLIVYSFTLRNDGRFELEEYTRALTDQGLDIAFERVVDGEVTRRVTGRTVTAK
jgi:hypothetical protein